MCRAQWTTPNCVEVYTGIPIPYYKHFSPSHLCAGFHSTPVASSKSRDNNTIAGVTLKRYLKQATRKPKQHEVNCQEHFTNIARNLNNNITSEISELLGTHLLRKKAPTTLDNSPPKFSPTQQNSPAPTEPWIGIAPLLL